MADLVAINDARPTADSEEKPMEVLLRLVLTKRCFYIGPQDAADCIRYIVTRSTHSCTIKYYDQVFQ